MVEPLVPRDWRTLNAIHDAKKKMLSVYCTFPHGRSSSKPYCFTQAGDPAGSPSGTAGRDVTAAPPGGGKIST